MNLSEKEKDRIFRKARKIEGLDADEWRFDACDAIIYRHSYGRNDDFFGWEVDHIVPQSLLEENGVPQNLIDDFRNLRPLNWRNNVSKGDDYPVYKAEISSKDGGESNVIHSSNRIVNKVKQRELRDLYAQYLKL